MHNSSPNHYLLPPENRRRSFGLSDRSKPLLESACLCLLVVVAMRTAPTIHYDAPECIVVIIGLSINYPYYPHRHPTNLSSALLISPEVPVFSPIPYAAGMISNHAIGNSKAVESAPKRSKSECLSRRRTPYIWPIRFKGMYARL